jgi:hypothetical protein
MRLHLPQVIMGRNESSIFSCFPFGILFDWHCIFKFPSFLSESSLLRVHFIKFYFSIYLTEDVACGLWDTHNFSGEGSLWNHHDDDQIIRTWLGRGGARWSVSKCHADSRPARDTLQSFCWTTSLWKGNQNITIAHSKISLVPNPTYYSDLLIPLHPFDSSENLFAGVKGNHVDHSTYVVIWKQAHIFCHAIRRKIIPLGSLFFLF